MFQQDQFQSLCIEGEQDSLELQCAIPFKVEVAEVQTKATTVYVPDHQPAHRPVQSETPFARSKHWQIDTHDLDFEAVDPVLGSGSIGVVVKATFRGTPVAVKILRVGTDCNWKYRNAVTDMEQELAIVSECQRHPNIVFCFGCCSVQKEGTTPIPMIVYEYLGGGSLLQVFQRKTEELGSTWVPPSDCALSWCQQLTQAVRYLHTMDTPFAHRDIKLDNLLVSDDLKSLKLTDFSLATSLNQRGLGMTGSLRYMAPELHGQDSYDLGHADVYSTGITMWCILHGRRPFYNVRETSLVVGLVSMGVRPSFAKDKHNLQKTVEAAWHSDPKQRPSMSQLVDAVDEACKRQEKKPWKRLKHFLSGTNK